MSDTWRGRFVEVAVNARGEKVWSWWACVVCGRELSDGKSIERGIGPDCLRKSHVTELRADQLRRTARAIDRQAYVEAVTAERAWQELQDNLKRARSTRPAVDDR